MAGSFGYQAETAETSKAMAELSLLPAVRAASAETIIVADGTSCRSQISDCAGRAALHVVQVLASRLDPATGAATSLPKNEKVIQGQSA
jgi:Fe-S oxidoreductase